MPPMDLSVMLISFESINQNMRSTTAIIVGLIKYEPPVIDDTTQEEIAAGKHVVKLEDISLVSTNRNNTNGQSLNLPWMNAQSTGEGSRTRTNRTPRGATPRTSRRGRTTLAQMSQPRNQNFPSALEANPILNMSTSPINNESSVPHKILKIKRFNDYFEEYDSHFQICILFVEMRRIIYIH
ncbi:unnamed protein product [Rhizophagus irregularis]|nr:unnamed protein product [Rhizophagus irregularis]